MLLDAIMNEQHDKVLNCIRTQFGKNPRTRLHNDEYFIGMKDIYTELSYWASKGKFTGKNIICPCDCDITSDSSVYAIEIIYDASNPDADGLNCTIELYKCDEKNNVTTEIIPSDKIESFIYDELKCGFLRTLTQHASEWGISSITASGYDVEANKGFLFQDIDFTLYDVCITNPPKSMFSHFVNAVVGKIDFIIVAPFINRAHTIPMQPMMLKQAYLGKGRRIRPNFTNHKISGNPIRKDLHCDWLVSFPEAQDEINASRYSTGVRWELYKDEYHVMNNITMKDGRHPIKVNNIKAMPDDYDGWMLCAAGVFDVLSYDEFEWYPTQCTSYFNDNPDKNPYAHKASAEMLRVDWKDNEKVFDGVVIRRKTLQPIV